MQEEDKSLVTETALSQPSQPGQDAPDEADLGEAASGEAAPDEAVSQSRNGLEGCPRKWVSDSCMISCIYADLCIRIILTSLKRLKKKRNLKIPGMQRHSSLAYWENPSWQPAKIASVTSGTHVCPVFRGFSSFLEHHSNKFSYVCINMHILMIIFHVYAYR